MEIFTMVKHTTGTGKDLKAEYGFTGNVDLMRAQQMLTEITIISARNEARQQVKEEAANVQQEQKNAGDAQGPEKAK